MPDAPDYFEDTKIIRRWLAGGTVASEPLIEQLDLWSRHLKHVDRGNGFEGIS